ncbi:DUF1364 domain-containing protein [Wohlfahrtiimonas populi]|uniref:DUF1364 domain-containing protein n=1 Tax=Wohlfahrtiimonas populi TaxID=1940240 RepID=UPI000BBDEAA8|nr:DUF1364 domain-containing protein [Wohlfahrtiimonas populi]
MANLRKLAHGKECQVRIPNVCNFNNETTVLAHVPIKGSAGMGQKTIDLIGTWCCSNCHDVIDGRVKSQFSREEIDNMKYEGMIRTQLNVVRMGAVKW